VEPKGPRQAPPGNGEPGERLGHMDIPSPGIIIAPGSYPWRIDFDMKRAYQE